MEQLELHSKIALDLKGSIFWSIDGNREFRKKKLISNSPIASCVNSILFNLNGKPYLLNGKVFSISHSIKYSVMVVSDFYSSIGIDIEVNRPFRYWTRVAKRYFLETEQKYCEGDDGLKKFWMIWVKKEAILKCLGGSIFENALDVDTFNYCDFLNNGNMKILYSVLTNCGQEIHVSIAYC